MTSWKHRDPSDHERHGRQVTGISQRGKRHLLATDHLDVRPDAFSYRPGGGAAAQQRPGKPHPPFVPKRRSCAGHGGDQRGGSFPEIVDCFGNLDSVDPQADPHREGRRQQDRRGTGDRKVAVGVPATGLHARENPWPRDTTV